MKEMCFELITLSEISSVFDKMVITTKFQIVNPHFGTILAGIKPKS